MPKKMKYKVAEDAKPQLILLLIATAITIALWFIPFADYLVYPIRLFVTFIHEGSHALASVLTGSSVQSLSVSGDGSGMVSAVPSNWLFRALYFERRLSGNDRFRNASCWFRFAALIRRASFWRLPRIRRLDDRFIRFSRSGLEYFFGAGQHSEASLLRSVSGALLTVGLLAIAKYASAKFATFALSFLAVQCLLNALLDLKTLFFINAPIIGSDMHTDAANMAAATGLPAIAWVLIWIGILGCDDFRRASFLRFQPKIETAGFAL
jgi:hypothetical protein